MTVGGKIRPRLPDLPFNEIDLRQSARGVIGKVFNKHGNMILGNPELFLEPSLPVGDMQNLLRKSLMKLMTMESVKVNFAYGHAIPLKKARGGRMWKLDYDHNCLTSRSYPGMWQFSDGDR